MFVLALEFEKMLWLEPAVVLALEQVMMSVLALDLEKELWLQLAITLELLKAVELELAPAFEVVL